MTATDPIASSVSSSISSSFAQAESRLADSPVLSRLCRAVAADAELVRPVWPLDTDPSWSMVLRLFTAAHHTLREHVPGHPLASYYPTLGGSRPPDDGLPLAFADLLARHEDRLAGWADRLPRGADPQSCAQLRPALSWAARELGGTDLALVELGGASGLGLCVDQFGYAYECGPERTVRCGDGPVTLTCEASGVPDGLLTDSLRITSRTELEMDAIDLSDDDALAWALAVAAPEAVAQQQRVRAAAELCRDLPLDWRDGDLLQTLPAVLADLPGHLLPVVHGVSVLCCTQERERILGVLTAAGRDLVWVLAEVPGIALPLVTSEPPEVTPSDRSLTGVVIRDGMVDRVVLLATGDQDGSTLRWDPREMTPLPESTPSPS